MVHGFEHTADAEETEVAVNVGDADPLDALDLAGRDHEALGDLVDRTDDRDVLLQPADWDLHQSCLRTRRSFSQNIRLSGMPWRCAAMRSSPSPQANPVHSSGSMPMFANTAGSTTPAPPISNQPEYLQKAQPSPPHRKQVTSNSTEGSVNGKKPVRMRTSRSSPNIAWKKCRSVPFRSARPMLRSTASASTWWKFGVERGLGVSRR